MENSGLSCGYKLRTFYISNNGADTNAINFSVKSKIYHDGVLCPNSAPKSDLEVGSYFHRIAQKIV